MPLILSQDEAFETNKSQPRVSNQDEAMEASNYRNERRQVNWNRGKQLFEIISGILE